MSAMDKRGLSERDICTKFITPALRNAGWDEMLQIREQVSFTKGRIIVRGKLVTRGQAKRADYILYFKPNIPIALIEAKDNARSVGDGMQQGLLFLKSPHFIETGIPKMTGTAGQKRVPTEHFTSSPFPLGQGAFRVVVTDIYQRRCAVTQERTLPALEAAHIRPYGDGGGHEARNGLLLRRDIHSLFDAGYVTVTPDLHFEVSRRIKEEFENGRHYYAHHGHKIEPPLNTSQRPDPEALMWHNDHCFRG